GVVDFLGDQRALLDPAFGSSGCAHPGKAAVASDNLDRFSVFHRTRLVINSCYLVAQKGLRGGNVCDLLRPALATVTAEKQSNAGKTKGQHAERGKFAAVFHERTF